MISPFHHVLLLAMLGCAMFHSKQNHCLVGAFSLSRPPVRTMTFSVSNDYSDRNTPQPYLRNNRFVSLRAVEKRNDEENNIESNKDEDDCDSRSRFLPSRREALQRAVVVTTAMGQIFSSLPANSADLPTSSMLFSPPSSKLGNGLLESRVTENLMTPPSYGLEVTDIFYPS
jgi:hypothetical protein